MSPPHRLHLGWGGPPGEGGVWAQVLEPGPKAEHRRGIGAVVAFLVVLAALAGCAAGDGDSAGQRISRGGKADDSLGAITQVKPADRQPAPALTGTTLDGEQLDLADYRGKVVVLNVWASWCGPCREEIPALERVYQDTRSRDVAFVGILARDRSLDAARAFARRYGMSYPSLVDPDGQLVLSFRGTLPPAALPSTLVLDRQGRIAVRALTPLTERQLRSVLDPVIAEEAR